MTPLVHITGTEQAGVDPTLADAGLPPVVGVQSVQIFRASRDAPELTDGRGWTYHHHVDMACWQGRLYIGWNSCERDEDVWPSRELYSTSADGMRWADPAELFPQGTSTPLRMYFYHASNGRMLAIAGLRVDEADTDEDVKGGLIVREISTSHELRSLYTLQAAPSGYHSAPLFTASADERFVVACQELLNNRPYLEQQDRGRLLGDLRMKWHDAAQWGAEGVPGDDSKWVAGKAYSFLTRPDGVTVGFSKMGWVTTTTDDGNAWTRPTVPPTLVTGKAKVWAQRTADGRFALVYNPSRRNRFPLAIVSGDDGITFSGMRIVQGELPRQRYTGTHRSIGPQYVRGISAWADDGSRSPEQVLWLTYSMSKEDIWVSRVPLPVELDAAPGEVADRFSSITASSVLPCWNTYSPKWGEVALVDGALTLRSDDPYDYASATRVFSEFAVGCVAVELSITGVPVVPLELELRPAIGPCRPVVIRFMPAGGILIASQLDPIEIGRWSAGQRFSLSLFADCGKRICRLHVGVVEIDDAFPFAEPAESLQRLMVRTGPFRGIGGANPVPSGTDRPIAGATLKIHAVRVVPGLDGDDRR